MNRDRRRPLIMGILNLTPDSFSDGGQHNTLDSALSHIRRMVLEGADIIDIGGESTRPGASRIAIQEQLARTVDIIAACRREIPERIDISIDTTRAQVAEAALNVGATMINDVTAGTDDPSILDLAAERKVPICLMHMQGRPADMQHDPHYRDVLAEVRQYLLERTEVAIRCGVDRERLIIDPGIGFGKTAGHNLRLLAGLPGLVECGYPVLLGASRKGFLKPYSRAAEAAADRLIPSCATTVIGVQAGVRIFRVHDVQANREAADTAWDVCKAGC